MKIKEDKSIFLSRFGDTPQLRVLDFLMGNYFFDYPVTEIARESNVSYNSLTKFFEEWVKVGILTRMRKVGKSDYFKLNVENEFVKNIMKLNWKMVKDDILAEKVAI